MVFIPPVPPSKTSLQQAYDKDANILYDGSKSIYMRGGGVEYGSVGTAFFVADTADVPGVGAVGFNAVRGVGFFPSFASAPRVIGDTTVTFPSATQIDLGTDLLVAGMSTATGVVNILVLKSADVAADISSYLVTAVSNGIAANSVVTLTDLRTFAPATFTSTTGIAQIAQQGDYFGGNTAHLQIIGSSLTNPGGGTFEILTATGGTNLTSAIQITSDSGATMSQGIAYTNNGSGFNGILVNNQLGGALAGSLLELDNYENTALSDIPCIAMTNLSAGPDIRFTNRGADPTVLFAGDLWFNSAFKYFDGAVTQTLARIADLPATPNLNAVLTAGNTTGGQDIVITDGDDLVLPLTKPSGGRIIQGLDTLIHTYTNGSPNIFIGPGAGNFTLTTSGYDIGIGENTLKALTTGNTNTAIGHDTANILTIGDSNTFLGGAVAQSLISGNNNVAVGYASFLNGTAGNNTSVGFSAGRALTSGTNNTFIGYTAGFTGTTGTITNSTAIGSNAQVTASNTVVLGDSATVVMGATAPTSASDKAEVVGNLRITTGRLLGASTTATAANDLTLGNANQFIVSGNTQINAITTTGWTAGSKVTLIFSGTPTVKHNTAGGAGTAVLFLAGSADLTAAANTVLGLEYDGTQWQETFRKVA